MTSVFDTYVVYTTDVVIALSYRQRLASSYCIGVARIFDWGGPNLKSHAMTSAETSKKKFFVGAKIS